jgi:hypothetical protein
LSVCYDAFRWHVFAVVFVRAELTEAMEMSDAAN